jgi:hypothetical protein
MNGTVKPGIKTTEFWLTLLTPISTFVLLTFHTDVSGWVPGIASVASSIATAVYAISRAHLKKSVTP